VSMEMFVCHHSSLALLFGIGIPRPREVGWLALVMEGGLLEAREKS
jgi:hypothetical protein